MSRSFKKHTIVKDTNKLKKQLANRKFRRVNKFLLKDEKPLKLHKELTNPYNICDWVFIATKRDKFYKKFKRK